MSQGTSTTATRFPLIDGLKAVATQFILLHHMAAYGPLADAIQHAFPDLVAWLYDYGRMAVQVFLVLGGYLAARALAPGFGQGGRRPVTQFIAVTMQRYLRLALPFLGALALAVLCAAIARHWMDDADFIPAAPTLDQLIAHGLLLHGVLEYEALSAGAWYVAIDFQLFVLLAGLLWLGERGARYSPHLRHLDLLLVTGLSVASIFSFNRNAQMDAWALYFFGTYGLGTLTYWAHQRRHGAAPALLLVLFLIPFALLTDFRWRLVVALATTLTLVFSVHLPTLSRSCRSRVIHHLGKTSYALFLVQFPIYMAATALCVHLDLLDSIEAPRNALFALVIIWAASIYAATLFHRWVEAPASRLRIGERAQRTSQAVHEGQGKLASQN